MTLRELLSKLDKTESDRQQRRLMNETTERNGAAPVSVTTVNGAIQSTCTRCGTVLSIPAAGSNANFEIAAHQNRCFAPGDLVRWTQYTGAMWVDGQIESLTGMTAYITVAKVGGNWLDPPSIGSMWEFNRSSVLLLERRNQATPAPSATVERSTTILCMRCGVEVPFGHVHSLAAATAAMTDHEERCFVIGDRVRTVVHPIIEGTVSGLDHCGVIVASPSYRQSLWFGRVAVRRVEGAASGGGGGGVISAEFVNGCVTDDDIKREITKRGWSTAWPATSDREPIAPTLYDGITAKQCLDRMLVRMAAADGEIDPSRIPDWPVGRTVTQELVDGVIHLTTSQLAAARELWSAQLRAKVEASREAERRQVTIDQDADDLPW